MENFWKTSLENKKKELSEINRELIEKMEKNITLRKFYKF